MLTLDALPSTGHPEPDRCGIVDVSACGVSLAMAFHAAARCALLRLFGMQGCGRWRCLHNTGLGLGLGSFQDLCPLCLRKVCHATGLQPLARYRQLAPLYLSTKGFEAAGGWVAERMRYLDSSAAPDLSMGADRSEHAPTDRIEARFSNGEWYPARVTHRHGDGTCDVLFEDGIALEALPPDAVRSLAPPAVAPATAPSPQTTWAPSPQPPQVLGNQLATLKARHGKRPRRKGCQPASSPERIGAEDELSAPRAKACLEAFYRRHHPDKLPGIDKLLRGYQGREAALLAAVEAKYGLATGALARSAAA